MASLIFPLMISIGASIFMLCRSEEKGKKAQRDIIELSNNYNVYLEIVDISRPRSIADWVQKQFRDDLSSKVADNKIKNVDILVNNAGILTNKLQYTADGLEQTFATNSLGSYVLTRELIPYMNTKNSRAKIIFVSSGGMYTCPLYVDDLQLVNHGDFNGAMSYAHTKRQQVLMAEYFSQNAEKFGNAAKYIDFYSMHPGWSETPGVKSSIPEFYRVFGSMFRSAKDGIDTILWLAEPDTIAKSGEFYLDRKPVRKNLPGAGTQSNEKEIMAMMEQFDSIYKKVIQSG